MLRPFTIVIIKIHSLMLETSVQLLSHDASLKSASSVGRVNEVTIGSHHEPYKCDAHAILVEENVWVGAVVEDSAYMKSKCLSHTSHGTLNTSVPTVFSLLSDTAQGHLLSGPLPHSPVLPLLSEKM